MTRIPTTVVFLPFVQKDMWQLTRKWQQIKAYNSDTSKAHRKSWIYRLSVDLKLLCVDNGLGKKETGISNKIQNSKSVGYTISVETQAKIGIILLSMVAFRGLKGKAYPKDRKCQHLSICLLTCIIFRGFSNLSRSFYLVSSIIKNSDSNKHICPLFVHILRNRLWFCKLKEKGCWEPLKYTILTWN